jgi:hypothetical protein
MVEGIYDHVSWSPLMGGKMYRAPPPPPPTPEQEEWLRELREEWKAEDPEGYERYMRKPLGPTAGMRHSDETKRNTSIRSKAWWEKRRRGEVTSSHNVKLTWQKGLWFWE